MKYVKSITMCIVVLVLCVIDFNMRSFPKGHIVCLLSDRPFSFVILIALGVITYWAHLTKRNGVRNFTFVAMGFIAF